MFTIMREFSVLFLLITTLSSSETWTDAKKTPPKNKNWKKPRNPRWNSRNLIIRCLIAQPGSVFHIILKLLTSSHVMAKRADTMLGHSCCHNSSYLANDVKEDKVLLWAYTKLLHIMSPVHKEEGKKEMPPFFGATTLWFYVNMFVKRRQNHLQMTGCENHRRGWRGSPRFLQEMQLKLRVNKIGKARKKKDKEILESKLALSSTRSSRSQLQLCGKYHEGVTLWRTLCPQRNVCHRLPGLEIQVSMLRTHIASMSIFFVSPSTLQRKRTSIWLKHLHIMGFFSLHQGAGELALLQKWFPNKIINNNAGTLFLERRFVSVPQWASRGKISCYTLRKK